MYTTDNIKSYFLASMKVNNSVNQHQFESSMKSLKLLERCSKPIYHQHHCIGNSFTLKFAAAIYIYAPFIQVCKWYFLCFMKHFNRKSILLSVCWNLFPFACCSLMPGYNRRKPALGTSIRKGSSSTTFSKKGSA